MSIATRDQIEKYSRHITEELRKSASKLSATTNLFLSHSSEDKGPLLLGGIEALHRHGARVYADVLDPEAKGLPPNKFGEFFNQAISDTERLVALVTSNTASSRWVPWELGLAHGIHSIEKVAIWPVRHRRETDSWAKQEYFELYPRIEWVNLTGGEQWGVRNPATGKYRKLKRWLGTS